MLKSDGGPNACKSCIGLIAKLRAGAMAFQALKSQLIDIRGLWSLYQKVCNGNVELEKCNALLLAERKKFRADVNRLRSDNFLYLQEIQDIHHKQHPHMENQSTQTEELHLGGPGFEQRRESQDAGDDDVPNDAKLLCSGTAKKGKHSKKKSSSDTDPVDKLLTEMMAKKAVTKRKKRGKSLSQLSPETNVVAESVDNNKTCTIPAAPEEIDDWLELVFGTDTGQTPAKPKNVSGNGSLLQNISEVANVSYGSHPELDVRTGDSTVAQACPEKFPCAVTPAVVDSLLATVPLTRSSVILENDCGEMSVTDLAGIEDMFREMRLPVLLSPISSCASDNDNEEMEVEPVDHDENSGESEELEAILGELKNMVPTEMLRAVSPLSDNDEIHRRLNSSSFSDRDCSECVENQNPKFSVPFALLTWTEP